MKMKMKLETLKTTEDQLTMKTVCMLKIFNVTSEF